jgi:hypothetical protein
MKIFGADSHNHGKFTMEIDLNQQHRKKLNRVDVLLSAIQ